VNFVVALMLMCETMSVAERLTSSNRCTCTMQSMKCAALSCDEGTDGSMLAAVREEDRRV
jgi:hypothetical protein